MPFPCSRLLTCGAMVLSTMSPAIAQSVCSSEGQSPPTRLMERFTSADCATCWSDPATAPASPGIVVLDWVLPGAKGDAAALSAVASSDGLDRLALLGQSAPASASVTAIRVTKPASLSKSTLRVARGLTLSGYIGASIELQPAPRMTSLKHLTVWLALVEVLPAGLEGSPVERNLVRNVFQSHWNLGRKLSKEEHLHWFDQRSMSVAQGVNPDRLQVIGWLADDKGRVVSAAQSKCVAVP